MNKKKGIISLILIAVVMVLLGFTTAVGFGKTGTGAMKNIKLGLDLAGGVSITYQVEDKNPSAEEMSDTIYKLQLRVEQYSTEASVYQEGDDRINIEIPGVSDANAILDELGKPGSLEFQTSDGESVITGADVKTASVQSGQDDMGNAEYSVELVLNEEGTKKFADATEANIGQPISIIYDGETISSPTVQSARGGKPCFHHPDRRSAVRAYRAPLQCGGRATWRGGHQHQPFSRSDWLCDRIFLYDLCILSAGTGIRDRALYLH